MSFQNYNIADLGTATLGENISETKDSFSIENINNLPGTNTIITIGEKSADGASILYIEKVKYTTLASGVVSNVTRGFGGTQKRTFTAGAIIRLNVEVEIIKDIQDEVVRLNSAKAEDNVVVKLTGDQTIAGNKKFSSSVKIESTSERRFEVDRSGIINRLGYNYVGTFSDDDFRFFSNSTERARITKEGNFLLGLTSASEKFNIYQNSNTRAFNITSLATTTGIVQIYTNAVHTGTGHTSLVSIRNDNSDSTGDVLRVQNDGTGKAFKIDSSGIGAFINQSPTLNGNTNYFEPNAPTLVLTRASSSRGSCLAIGRSSKKSYIYSSGGGLWWYTDDSGTGDLQLGGVEQNNNVTKKAVMKIGAFHIWVDNAGKLRIKSSSPGSDTDGTIVGTQS